MPLLFRISNVFFYIMKLHTSKKYGMLDNISLCGCPIPTPPVIEVAVAISVLH